MFTVKEDVVNKGGQPVTLYPYGLISRHGKPKTAGYYILHEGMIGYLNGLQEVTYKKLEDKKAFDYDVKDGWLGITDKYWAATLLPSTNGAHEGALLHRHRRQADRPTRPTTCSTRTRSRRAQAPA